MGGYTVSVGSPTEIAAKLNAMQRLSALPLLFGADYEFGAGYRARGGYFLPNAIDLGGAVVFPPQMAIGASHDTLLAYEQGVVTAREGRAIGVHIAYAPLLDVNNNPANPVINTRSYGGEPRLVAAMGRNFIRGLQANGMLATGKHFPGHGDTGTNSHLALPVVNVSRARLDSVELVPFRSAIRDADLAGIMSFHGVMPALDSSGVPGTLSPRVLGGVLRGELGFNGLIISDAMDMRGVLDQFGAEEATKRAVAAGIDVLIQPLDVAQTIDAVVAGVAEGRYPESRVNDAARRILADKERLGLQRTRTVPLDSVRTIVGIPAHQAAAQRAADSSITLVRNAARQLPIATGAAAPRVLSISYASRTDLGAGLTFDAELRHAVPRLRSELITFEDPGIDYPRLLAAADSADVVIVSSYVSHRWNAATAGAPRAFVDFLKRLGETGKPPVVISFGNPYLLQQIPAIPTYVAAWGGFPISQSATARAVTGQLRFAGRLPITIPLDSTGR